MQLHRLLPLLLALLPVYASATPIDLNQFQYVGLAAGLTVTPDGSSATLTEDPLHIVPSVFFLDPSLGHPDLIIPAVGTSLEFDFEYTAGIGLLPAEFSAALFDSASSEVLANFLINTTSSGTVSFDLSGLVGRVLGLNFALGVGIGGSPSAVTISDVELVSEVPEPTTLALLGIGLAGLGLTRRRRKV